MGRRIDKGAAVLEEFKSVFDFRNEVALAGGAGQLEGFLGGGEGLVEISVSGVGGGEDVEKAGGRIKAEGAGFLGQGEGAGGIVKIGLGAGG